MLYLIKQKNLEGIIKIMPKGINKPLTDGLKKETFLRADFIIA